MKIEEAKLDGNKVVACKLDGEFVVHCNKADNLNPKKWWDVIGRVVSGGAVTGYVSAFLKDVDETGYYTTDKKIILGGTIYKNEKGEYFL